MSKRLRSRVVAAVATVDAPAVSVAAAAAPPAPVERISDRWRDTFPTDLLVMMIAAYCSPVTAAIALTACRSWQTLAKSDRVWRPMMNQTAVAEYETLHPEYTVVPMWRLFHLQPQLRLPRWIIIDNRAYTGLIDRGKHTLQDDDDEVLFAAQNGAYSAGPFAEHVFVLSACNLLSSLHDFPFIIKCATLRRRCCAAILDGTYSYASTIVRSSNPSVFFRFPAHAYASSMADYRRRAITTFVRWVYYDTTIVRKRQWIQIFQYQSIPTVLCICATTCFAAYEHMP